MQQSLELHGGKKIILYVVLLVPMQQSLELHGGKKIILYVLQNIQGTKIVNFFFEPQIFSIFLMDKVFLCILTRGDLQ